MTHGKAVKKPVPVSWYRWEDVYQCEDAIKLWTMETADAPEFRALSRNMAVQRYEDSSFTAEVWDKLHARWIPLRTGDYVMRGISDEHYPCAAKEFALTYDITEEFGG